MPPNQRSFICPPSKSGLSRVNERAYEGHSVNGVFAEGIRYTLLGQVNALDIFISQPCLTFPYLSTGLSFNTGPAGNP